MSIAILYERAGTDEMGIQLTAQKLGIDLIHIPFRKVSFLIGNSGYHIRSKGKDHSETLNTVSVILNRAQSKNRRMFAASILEALGKNVINPQHVEYTCASKLRTLLHFWKEKVRIPETVYVPCDPKESTEDGHEISNENEIADLIQQELGNKTIVVKPDAGSHGKMIQSATKRQELLKILGQIQPSIINPIGVFAQEMIQKWFFDLRIIVAKEKGKTPQCYPTAMARTGLKDFRTNTYLGNMVFGVKLPSKIREASVKGAESIGKNCEAWVLALDAMIDFGEEKIIDENMISEFRKLTPLFNEIQKARSEKINKENFVSWNKKFEETFQKYKASRAYEKIKEVIEESINNMKNRIVFHEANSCPDFWEYTRLAAGINLAEKLLLCAQSVMKGD
jgi:glutathione synthase/RimK-type ligase-like ATP-grasp enzyme